MRKTLNQLQREEVATTLRVSRGHFPGALMREHFLAEIICTPALSLLFFPSEFQQDLEVKQVEKLVEVTLINMQSDSDVCI